MCVSPRDSLLQLPEMQSLLRALQLPSGEEDCAMWLRAFETTPNPVRQRHRGMARSNRPLDPRGRRLIC